VSSGPGRKSYEKRFRLSINGRSGARRRDYGKRGLHRRLRAGAREKGPVSGKTHVCEKRAFFPSGRTRTDLGGKSSADTGAIPFTLLRKKAREIERQRACPVFSRDWLERVSRGGGKGFLLEDARHDVILGGSM